MPTAKIAPKPRRQSAGAGESTWRRTMGMAAMLVMDMVVVMMAVMVMAMIMMMRGAAIAASAAAGLQRAKKLRRPWSRPAGAERRDQRVA